VERVLRGFYLPANLFRSKYRRVRTSGEQRYRHDDHAAPVVPRFESVTVGVFYWRTLFRAGETVS